MRWILAGVVALAVAGPGLARAGEQGGAGAPGAAAVSTGKEYAHGISRLERRIIAAYLNGGGRAPPALAGAEPLPPEVATALAPGRPLPAGVAGRPLPPDLLAQLPPRPGYEWLVVGTDIVLFFPPGRSVYGILRDPRNAF